MEFEESISPHERVEQTGRNAGNPSFSVQVCRRLQDMVKAVSLGYVVVGYKYMVNNGYYIAMLPVFVMIFVAEMGNLTKEGLRVGIMGRRSYDLATLIVSLGVLILTVAIFFISRPRTIYLLDFACYRPSDELKVSKEEFMEKVRKSGKFNEKTLKFQNQVLESSGIGDETYLPKAVLNMENPATMKEGRDETAAVLFGALDELFEKTGVKPRDVGILVVNCSIFNPTPSISAMIVNRYKMRTNTLTYNLGGMGCSASIIAVDLAKEILQANSNSLALVVSTEIITFSWYRGTERSMLIPNCFFRMGGSAVLLSNRWKDCRKSKYELEHIVRVHKGSDERSFRCIYQDEDKEGFKGLGIKRDIIEVGVQALKANIATLAPLVLPFSEQIKFFNFLIRKHLFGSDENTKPYIPNYKLAFNHFCIQGTSKPVLEELQKHLELSGSSMEASKMSLHRFGHTSSSSIWYILAYLEAKEKVDGGDRIWQLAFGSGFKCNSAVWRALHRVKKPSRNPWLDCIDQYPLNI